MGVSSDCFYSAFAGHFCLLDRPAELAAPLGDVRTLMTL